MLSEDVLEVFKPLSISVSAYERRHISWNDSGCCVAVEGVGHCCPLCSHLHFGGGGTGFMRKGRGG